MLSQTFGADLALTASGTRLVVGSPLEIGGAAGIDGDQANLSSSNAGAVYVFETILGGAWEQFHYLKASNPPLFTNENDNFGISVAVSLGGDVIAVGASGEDSGSTGVGGEQENNNAANSGAVYLY